MASDILLKQTAPGTFTYRIDNIDKFSPELNQPATPFPIPESSHTEAILIKIEGNTMIITISWLLIDRGAGNTAVDELTGGSAIRTVEEQRNFLFETFESKGINYKFNVTVEGVSPSFSKNGLVTKMNVDKDAIEPEHYRANVQFVVGTLIDEAPDTQSN